MAVKLLNKIAVVTGGTRGIGAAIAKELFDLGANVYITGTKKNYVSPEEFQYLHADFNIQNELTALTEKMSDMKIDILINNAGINKIGPILELEVADFVKVQSVNVTAPFMFCQAVLPHMRDSKWGRIVNISSIWGKISKAHRAPYSASKFAIDGLTAAISAEVAVDNVLVNSVAPGFVDTELTRSILGDDGINELIATVPARRIGNPQEIATFVAWLASPDNTYISGQNIAIDGGFTRV
ncbi:3-oxoacyl-[acyl-carrier protein] reductase [hydrothermal vent metagenome]|uniref:3-oxoacyl-[acyl-carrier protein] reductase n=1 Tax=hydrothermal vent metagenome TaxID=652676 RepID=A0A3B0XSY8_9ZZZZ